MGSPALKPDRLHGLKILLVEDSQPIRALVREYLEPYACDVTEAASGTEGLQKMKGREYSLIITDVRMPALDGLQFLTKLRSAGTNTPILLISGFADVMSHQDARRLGASGFLGKPFFAEDLYRAMEYCLDESKGADMDSDYCPIPLDTFTSGTKLPVDIFVRMSSERYFPIGRRGGILDLDRLRNRLKDHGIQEIHVRKRDLPNYVDQGIRIHQAMDAEGLTAPHKRQAFLNHLSETLVKNFLINGLEQETFEKAKGHVVTTVKMLLEDKTALDLLVNLERFSDAVYAHSLGVSLYAALIARKMGESNRQVLQDLCIAGIFHDVGKLQMDKSTIETPENSLSETDREALRSHPIKGVSVLRRISAANARVSEMVLQHHETRNGTGYPMGLTDDRINPYSLVLRLADEFCSLVVPRPDRPRHELQAALNELRSRHYLFSQDSLKALLRCFPKL